MLLFSLLDRKFFGWFSNLTLQRMTDNNNTLACFDLYLSDKRLFCFLKLQKLSYLMVLTVNILPKINIKKSNIYKFKLFFFLSEIQNLKKATIIAENEISAIIDISTRNYNFSSNIHEFVLCWNFRCNFGSFLFTAVDLATCYHKTEDLENYVSKKNLSKKRL